MCDKYCQLYAGPVPPGMMGMMRPPYVLFFDCFFFSFPLSVIVSLLHVLRVCEMIDKVGQLLWAWFSRPRKLANNIVEP